MNYPNPGDFAVIINDKSAIFSQLNIGKKVYVEAFYTPRTVLEELIQLAHGQLVLITSLESLWVPKSTLTSSTRELCSPCSGIITARRFLQRIEPLCVPEADYEATLLPTSKEFSNATS